MKTKTNLDINDFVDINRKKGLPRKYRFNLVIRLIMIAFSFLVVGYALYFMFFKLPIVKDPTIFAKAVPIIVLFAGANTLFQNLFNIHTITITKDYFIASSILGLKRKIKWDSITKFSMNSGKKRYVIISYLDENNNKKQYNLLLVFKQMLEIINSMAELSPNAEYDEFLQTIVVSKIQKTTKVKNNEK